LLAWELPALGWKTEVLAPDIQFQRSNFVDSTSSGFFNSDVECHEVSPHDSRLLQRLGINSIGWRALWPLYRAGAALLSKKDFDVIYISTAHSLLFALGPLWRRRFKVPYVLDYHDPWVRAKSEYITTKHVAKQRMMRWISPTLERFALRGAAGVVAVSPRYLEELRQRYGELECLRPDNCEAIPFAGREKDLNGHLGASARKQSTPQTREIVYVGAGGAIMAKSFETICIGLMKLRALESDLLASIRIRLLGTYSLWKNGDSRPLEEIAARYGLADLVVEIPSWISYASAMSQIQESDGLLVLGVDDDGYMPSKLFTYALTNKPILVCLRDDSPALRFFDEMPGLGHHISFSNKSKDPGEPNLEALRGFLREVVEKVKHDRHEDLAGYLAPAMARRHARLFERAIARARLN
jgi:hypothetical protein